MPLVGIALALLDQMPARLKIDAARSRDRAPSGFAARRIQLQAMRPGSAPARSRFARGPDAPGLVGIAAMPSAPASRVCGSDDSATARGRRDRRPAPCASCSTSHLRGQVARSRAGRLCRQADQLQAMWSGSAPARGRFTRGPDAPWARWRRGHASGAGVAGLSK